MKTILKALYRGQLHSNEAIVPSHPEYRQLCRQVVAETEQWRNRLGEEALDIHAAACSHLVWLRENEPFSLVLISSLNIYY